MAPGDPHRSRNLDEGIVAVLLSMDPRAMTMNVVAAYLVAKFPDL